MTKLVIFTAPSGAGKTTVVRHLLKHDRRLAFSISACTREPRYEEVNGMSYYFMTVSEFKKKVAAQEFAEWQEVYAGQFYGTLKSEIDRLSNLGKHIIFDIDVKGAQNLKAIYGERALAVYVKPPSKEILVERLLNRRTEDNESLQRRLKRIAEELTYENHFDRVLLNDVLENTLAEAKLMVDEFLYGASQ